MKRILVTGATGFLGRHVIDTLLEQSIEKFGDRRLRLLCRSTAPWDDNARVETIRGEILDRQLVQRAVEDTDVIIHLAGRVIRDPARSAELFETHVEGTRNVCDAALKNGKPRILIASSSGTIALSRKPKMHDEGAPYAIDVAGNWPYYLSKIYQEKLAFSYFENEGLPIIVLNPSLLLGPGDVYLSSTRDVQMFLDGKIQNIPAGGLNFVDVRDAARTFVRAIDDGLPGRRYLVGGHDMTVRDFFYLIQCVSGVRAPLVSLSESWARGSADIIRRVMSFAGRRFPLDDTAIEMAYRFWYCDSKRAKRELGLTPRPAEETIRDTVAFLRTKS